MIDFVGLLSFLKGVDLRKYLVCEVYKTEKLGEYKLKLSNNGKNPISVLSIYSNNRNIENIGCWEKKSTRFTLHPFNSITYRFTITKQNSDDKPNNISIIIKGWIKPKKINFHV